MEEQMKKEYTPQQYKKFNGQSLMSALKYMGGTATAEDLCEVISASINQPEHVIKPEVLQVLRRGISNGFLERRGKTYLLYDQDLQIDHDAKKGPKAPTIRKTANKRNSEKPSKVAKLPKQRSAESILETILKASRQTLEAAKIATDAARQANITAEKIATMSKQPKKSKSKATTALI